MAECFLPVCKRTGKFLLHKNLDDKWQMLNEFTIQTTHTITAPNRKFLNFMSLTGLEGSQWSVVYPGGYVIYSISIAWVDTSKFDSSKIDYELGWFQLFSDDDTIEYDRATADALESTHLYHTLTTFIDSE